MTDLDTLLAAFMTRAVGPGTLSGLGRLSGGANMESWSFDFAGEPYVLRRAPSAEYMADRPYGHVTEAALVMAAHAAGVKAPEVVAINQDPAGHQGVLAYADSDRQIVVKTLADGRKAVLLFNRTGAPAKFTLTAEHLKMDSTVPIALRDAWA
eukprot:gene13849-16923_t